MFKQSAIIRTDASLGKRHHRIPEPIQDKESYRWLEHFNALQDYFTTYPNIELYNICDREGDFYELFAIRRVEHIHFIIRSQYSRSLKEDPNVGIHDKVANSSVKAIFKIDVTNRETCKKRKAIVQLKYCKVHFEHASPRKFQKNLPPITMWAIQVEEINPPKSIKPVKWILLTTKKISSISMAKTIVRYYVLTMHPPSIKDFVITIARLGGFTNFSNQPYSGLKVFWRRWNTFQTIVKSYQSFLSNE